MTHIKACDNERVDVPSGERSQKATKKKTRGKRWETKLELKKQLSKRGFKFTNAQLEKESITDLRKLLKTLSA